MTTMNWTRREFLRNAGLGSFILMALEAGLLSASDLKEIEEAIARGEENWISSVCQLCPGACGIRVRKLGNWPVTIAGNPLHPVNRGTLCPKGVAGILSFYDPDRIRSPMKRVGERGEGKWEPISWEEAIATVAGSLKTLREKRQAHQVAVLGGRYRGLMRTLWQRFLEAFGSPNYLDNSFASWQGPVEGLEKTQGVSAEPIYSLEKARYLLSFSAPLLEAGSSPVENLQGWAMLRRGDPAHRGKIVQIASHLSVTAAKADEWIPIQPGTEGPLAIGILSMIFRENLYDGLYLGSYSTGFGTFKNAVLENYSPQKIAETTGVPIDTIIRLAREFAASKPALAVSGRLDPRDQALIHTLNALVGSINVPGGVLIPRETDYRTFGPVEKDAVAEECGSKGKTVLITGQPYPLEAAFFYYTNPLFSNPLPERIREALAKIPLLVSFSPFLDETTLFCDLVLPDHHFLERGQDVPAVTMQGFPLVGLSQPVRSPLYDSRHTGDVLLDLARALGEPVSRSLPWSDFKAFLQEGLKRLYESGKGDLFGTVFESSWTSLLARGGWWSPSYASFEDFEKGLREKGGWWDPHYPYEDWAAVFANEEAKFAFPTDLPVAFPSSDDEFPLTLDTAPLMALTGGRNAGQAWLADIAGPHVQTGWKTWAEIAPATARAAGIKEGDTIWVESRVGRIQAVAKLFEGIHPKVVSLPFGFGHSAMGRWAAAIGENVRKIEEADPTLGDLPRGRITRVKVYRA